MEKITNMVYFWKIYFATHFEAWYIKKRNIFSKWDRGIIFPAKVENPWDVAFFSNLKPRNPPRDFRGLYFNLKTLCFEKCQIKLNYFFGKPPGSLLSLILEKSNISAFICIEKFLSGIHAHKHLKIFDFKIISGGHGERFILQSEQKNEICLGDSVLWKKFV